MEPTKSVDFLDLTISIESRRIVTRTYQKDLNLYQYISPRSNHPPKMMEGIIFSLLKNYKKQNTFEEDYLDMALKLFTRHVKRGWSRIQMKECILKADARLRLLASTQTTLPQPTTAATHTGGTTSNQRVFLHQEYCVNDLPRKAVRSILDDTCSGVFKTPGITQVTTCYSRPKNIKDLVTKAKLHQASGKEASKYYSGELSATW